MAKMKKKWVALCSTAIGAVYVAAYLATETQATMQQPQQQAQAYTQTESSQPQQQTQLNTPAESSQPQQHAIVNSPTKSSQPQQQTQVNTPTKSSQPQQQTQVNTPTKSSQPQQHAIVNTPTPTKSSQPKSLYKDGTYTGAGSNRRGSIEVAVTIKNDKITDVEITNFAMHYSENDVVGLPEEVLQKQSSQLQNVSGATYSTHAFEDAVQDALSQAHNR